MELKDTIDLMTSSKWEDRFKAEYLQTKIRYEKLHKMIIMREVGKQTFNAPIPLESLKSQIFYMGKYLYELEKQAAIHGIELPEVKTRKSVKTKIFQLELPRCGLSGVPMVSQKAESTR